MLAQAWKAYREHNYETAYQECKGGATGCEQSAEYHHLMALIMTHMQEPLLAENHFEISLLLQPNSVECMCGYAEFLLQSGEPVKAQVWLRRCLESGSKMEKVFLLATKCSTELDQLSQASDYLKKCLELHPTSRSARREAVRLEKKMARLRHLDGLTAEELRSRIVDLEASCDRLNEKESQPRCVLCLTKESNHVSVQCGHCCVCQECSKGLSKCPLCRKKAKYIRLFMS